MRKSKSKRLDYKVYAKTGVKIYTEASEVSEASASIQEEGQSSITINQKMEEYTEMVVPSTPILSAGDPTPHSYIKPLIPGFSKLVA